MIRPLDDLALLKEIDEISEIDYDSTYLRKQYPSKIVIIRHTAFIKKEVLCDKAINKVTNLTNYLQMGELTEQISLNNRALREKIYYMKKTGMEIFDYKIICGIYFIGVSNKFKELLQEYQPFLASYNDAENMIYGKSLMLGDLKIGFY